MKKITVFESASELLDFLSSPESRGMYLVLEESEYPHISGDGSKNYEIDELIITRRKILEEALNRLNIKYFNS